MEPASRNRSLLLHHLVTRGYHYTIISSLAPTVSYVPVRVLALALEIIFLH